MIVFSLFIPINLLTIFSLFTAFSGVRLVILGIQLQVRRRVLADTPRCKVGSAHPGFIELNGKATGPHTLPAPISGVACFLYDIKAWQQNPLKKHEWKEIAHESLHLPFFIDDATGQLLIEPLGADLDLLIDFQEEYAASLIAPQAQTLPPVVSDFLCRQGITPTRGIRIEERLIKPNDLLFVAGTLTENPGIRLRPLVPRENIASSVVVPNPNCNLPRVDLSNRSLRECPADREPIASLAEQAAPQVVRLAFGAAASSSQQMGQQAKIAAALTRAGIDRPEAWSAAGVSYQAAPIQQNAINALTPSSLLTRQTLPEPRPNENRPQPTLPAAESTPPLVMMKGADNPLFVISYRSQKEFIAALSWKSVSMFGGGVALILLGLNRIWVQFAPRW